MSAKLFGEFGLSFSDLGGKVGFQAGEQQPSLTSSIGQDLRNWLWKQKERKHFRQGRTGSEYQLTGTEKLREENKQELERFKEENGSGRTNRQEQQLIPSLNG
jgi:hypothetical protein